MSPPPAPRLTAGSLYIPNIRSRMRFLLALIVAALPTLAFGQASLNPRFNSVTANSVTATGTVSGSTGNFTGALSAGVLSGSTHQFGLTSGSKPLLTGFGQADVFGIYNPFPFGTYNTTCGFAITLNAGGNADGMCQSTGMRTLGQIAGYASRDMVGLYVGGNMPNVLAQTTGSAFTATSVTLATPLSAPVVAQIRQALQTCATQSAILTPAGNYCMLVEAGTGIAQTANKWTGPITSVSDDGATISVTAWVTNNGSGATATPPTGTAVYVNPFYRAVAINGVWGLPASALGTSSSYIEADLYNNKDSTANGVSMNGSEMHCNGTFDCNISFLALGQFNWGFYSNSTIGHPFAHCPTTSTCDWSVGSNGGMTVGNTLTANGFSLIPAASGSPPIIQFLGTDATVNARITGQGNGTLDAGFGVLTLGKGTATDSVIQAGPNRPSNARAQLQLIGDATYNGGGLLLSRGNAGPNTGANITHRGTGKLSIYATEAGSIEFGTNTTARLTFDGAGTATFAALVKLASYTVATLPACNSTNQDAMVVVSDATAPTYGGALTGGGTVRTPAYCNGSTWAAH